MTVVLFGALLAALTAGAKAQTWVQTSGPFDPSYGCRDMAFAKTSPQVGYLCLDDTLYSTTDGGLTWHIALSMGSIHGLVAIDEANANLAYAAGSSLRVSTDGGASWSTRTLPPGEMWCILAKGGKLWAGTVGGSGGLYRSVDTARTWSLTSTPPSTGGVECLVTGSLPSELYGATSGGGAGIGVIKSTDAGLNWFKSDSGLPGDANWLAAASSPAVVLYALTDEALQRLYKSTDGGASWHPTTFSDSLSGWVAVDPNNAEVVYVTTDHRIRRSTDGGSTWQQCPLWSNDWCPFNFYHGCLLVCPSGSIVFNANNRSTDGGQTWRSVGQGLPLASYGAVGVDPRNSGTAYAGQWKTTNGGSSWWCASPGYYTQPWVGNPDVVISSGWYSTDAGLNWSEIPSPPSGSVTASTVSPADLNVMYAPSGTTIYKTTNRGTSWRTLSPGVASSISCMAICKNHPNTLFIGGAFGCYRSTDGGETWIPRNDTLSSPSVGALAVDAVDDNWVYSTNRATYSRFSSDYGDHWTVSRDLRRWSLYDDIEISPLNRSIIYMPGSDSSGAQGGVLKSANRGQSWGRCGTGLPNAPVYALGISATALPVIYALVYGNGVWKCTDMTGSIAEPGQNTPSPSWQVQTVCRGALLIRDAPTDAGHNGLGLLDPLGRRVTTLHVGANDVSHLAPGVYFVCGGQEQAQSMRKVIISR